MLREIFKRREGFFKNIQKNHLPKPRLFKQIWKFCTFVCGGCKTEQRPSEYSISLDDPLPTAMEHPPPLDGLTIEKSAFSTHVRLPK